MSARWNSRRSWSAIRRADAAALPWYEGSLGSSPDDRRLLGGYAASLGELGRASDMLVVTRKCSRLIRDIRRHSICKPCWRRAPANIDLARAMLNRTVDGSTICLRQCCCRARSNWKRAMPTLPREVLDRLARSPAANPRVQLLLARALYDAGDYQRLFDRFGGMAERADALALSADPAGAGARGTRRPARRCAAARSGSCGGCARTMPLFEPTPPASRASAGATIQAARRLQCRYVRSLLAAGDMAGARRVAEPISELRPGFG